MYETKMGSDSFRNQYSHNTALILRVSVSKVIWHWLLSYMYIEPMALEKATMPRYTHTSIYLSIFR